MKKLRQTPLQQAQMELELVNMWLEMYFSRKSTWDNTVTWLSSIEEGKGTRGVKLPRCGIALSEALQLSSIRWATHMHELLHAFSSEMSNLYGFYPYYLGWEEGTVEQLQRLLLPFFLSGFLGGLYIENDIKESGRNRYNPYNKYIAALEGIRSLLAEKNEIRFYTELLEVPMDKRRNVLEKRFVVSMNPNKEEMQKFLSFCSVLDDNQV